MVGDRSFSHRDRGYYFRLALGLKDLSQAKQIDDAAFGIHHGITIEELMEIHNHGFVILLFDGDHEMVGQSQILEEPIEMLPHSFEKPTSYCYGIAIHPKFQGHGLGKVLAKEHELLAIERGMEVMEMTVRVENYASLRVMTGLGHKIGRYLPDFYGPNQTTDARVFLSKRLSPDFPASRDGNDGGVFVPVDYTSPYDAEAHQRIANLISTGHTGIHVDRNGIYFEKE